MKIRPTETELFHADSQKDLTKLTVAFRNFANAPTDGNVRTQLWPSADTNTGKCKAISLHSMKPCRQGTYKCVAVDFEVGHTRCDQ